MKKEMDNLFQTRMDKEENIKSFSIFKGPRRLNVGVV